MAEVINAPQRDVPYSRYLDYRRKKAKVGGFMRKTPGSHVSDNVTTFDGLESDKFENKVKDDWEHPEFDNLNEHPRAYWQQGAGQTGAEATGGLKPGSPLVNSAQPTADPSNGLPIYAPRPVSGGGFGSGASPGGVAMVNRGSAEATYDRMSRERNDRVTSAKAAAQKTVDYYANNPQAYADRQIQAKNEELAKSGITDMGGGNRMMRDGRNSGVVVTAPTGQKPKPGVISDEKGVVDLTASRAKEAADATNIADGLPLTKGGAVAYKKDVLAGTGSPFATTNGLQPRPTTTQVTANIASATQGAIPGSDDRITADRASAVTSLAANPDYQKMQADSKARQQKGVTDARTLAVNNTIRPAQNASNAMLAASMPFGPSMQPALSAMTDGLNNKLIAEGRSDTSQSQMAAAPQQPQQPQQQIAATIQPPPALPAGAPSMPPPPGGVPLQPGGQFRFYNPPSQVQVPPMDKLSTLNKPKPTTAATSLAGAAGAIPEPSFSERAGTNLRLLPERVGGVLQGAEDAVNNFGANVYGAAKKQVGDFWSGLTNPRKTTAAAQVPQLKMGQPQPPRPFADHNPSYV